MSICPETERTDPGRVIEREHVIEILIGFSVKDVLSNCPLNQHSSPAIRTAVLHCAKKCRTMMRTALQRE